MGGGSNGPEQLLPGKVLVVEDEAHLREIVSTRLSFLAQTVRAASDGAEARRMIEIDLPDVVVTDLMMPGVSGEDLCRWIRESPHTKDIYVLFLTARRGVVSRIAGFEAGADDYLEKPFDLDELAARVRRGLELRSLQREVQAKARLETIGWVAYAFGHEIRNPLAVIMANTGRQGEHARHLTTLGKAAYHAVKRFEALGAGDDASALKEVLRQDGGTAQVISELLESTQTNKRLVRRAAAAVSALQRFVEGASGRATRCDPALLLEDAVRLAFPSAEDASEGGLPVLRLPEEKLPHVWCVPRDALLALATALHRVSHPEGKGPPTAVEATLASEWVTVRIDGPGDGTTPENLLIPRIADQAPGEQRAGLDVGLAHALVALRATGAGLSVGPRTDGGVIVEILFPVSAPNGEEED